MSQQRKGRAKEHKELLLPSHKKCAHRKWLHIKRSCACKRATHKEKSHIERELYTEKSYAKRRVTTHKHWFRDYPKRNIGRQRYLRGLGDGRHWVKCRTYQISKHVLEWSPKYEQNRNRWTGCIENLLRRTITRWWWWWWCEYKSRIERHINIFKIKNRNPQLPRMEG